MSPKARPPVIRSVKKPEALSALRTWLGKFDEQTRERGEEYFSNGQVKNVGSDADHYVEAKVQGESLYSVTLFLTRDHWSSKAASTPTPPVVHGWIRLPRVVTTAPTRPRFL
jgi:uncharacterized Zn finger protein